MKIKRFFVHSVMQDKLLRQILSTVSLLCLAVIMGLLTSASAMACASCGCTLSSDWQNQQFSYTPGLKLDLRWDYIDQDQLRHGTETISPAAASQRMNNGMPQEVEKYTTNNYLTLGIDYSSKNPDWGVNVQVPYIFRSHSTLGTASDGFTAGPGGGQYNSDTQSLGDVRVVGRYQGFIPNCNLGVLFGFKLPTGSHTDAAASTDPTAPGLVPIDRGLQPGTGTTDIIFGAYYSDSLIYNFSYFAQAVFQKALYSTDQYMPGESLNLTLGTRYTGISAFEPQLQFNFRHVLRDTGADADVYSTGGTILYISPGVIVPVSRNFSVYGFVQLPLYQDLRGVQLAPHFTTSAGVRYSF